MMVLHWARFGLAALLMLAGMITLLAAILGLFRFQYVLNRIHVAAKCDAFGNLLIAVSLMVIAGISISSLKILLIIVFLWIANPVASHLIARLEVHSNPKVGEEYVVIPNPNLEEGHEVISNFIEIEKEKVTGNDTD